jgi:hypothetical protein
MIVQLLLAWVAENSLSSVIAVLTLTGHPATGAARPPLMRRTTIDASACELRESIEHL